MSLDLSKIWAGYRLGKIVFGCLYGFFVSSNGAGEIKKGPSGKLGK
jgi:hypothetical protein